MSAVPYRRVVALARYGMAAKATALRRHPEPRRLATLVATVRSLEAKAVDDAFELFDVLMTNDLLARAARESRDEKLRRYPRLSKDAGKLAAAVGVFLDALEHEQQLSLDLAGWRACSRGPISRTDIVFALITLLGFDYRPQLADLPDAKLWRIHRRRLRAAERGRARQDRPRPHRAPVAGHPARRRVDLHRRRPRLRHPARPRARRHADAAR